MGKILDKMNRALEDVEKAKTMPADEQFKIGLKYFKKSSDFYYEIAFKIFEIAAKNKQIQAMVYLARMYSEGLYVEENQSKAIEYLKQASDLGGINAKCILASIALTGSNNDVPKEDALKYYMEAADLGSLYAKFCIAEIYKNGVLVEKNYEKAIQFYSMCIEAEHTSKNMGILAESYCGLVQCYLELHYLEEANTTRDSKYYENLKHNKETAKKYLERAKEIRGLVSSRLKEKFENTLKIYEGILNEDSVELSKMSYGEFRNRFYNKHPRIFMPTKKSERLIYNDGIKLYFFKRDDSAEELEQALTQKENLIEKRRRVLKRVIQNLKISNLLENVDETMQIVEEKMLRELEDFRQNYLVDYSSCIINIDKYLEEILHYIFVVEMHNHKKQKLNGQIVRQESLIVKLIEKLSLEKLQRFNNIVNGISMDVSLGKISEEKHVELLTKFISKLISNKTPKSSNRRLENLSVFRDDNLSTINEEEALFIEKVLELNEMVEACGNMKMNTSFQLGSLFDLTFVENYIDESVVKMARPNKLKDDILEYVYDLNKNLTKDEIYIKLQELILKVEYFRVMIRNVASHKSILTQSAIEKGLNLCIVQESSIFNLLDELFGEYLEKQSYIRDVENFTSIIENDESFNKVDAYIVEILNEDI